MAMFPTEEELARNEKLIQQNKQILEQNKQSAQAMQDMATAKQMLSNLDDADIQSAQEALLLQQEAFEIEEKKRELAKQGLTISTAEEISYQNKLEGIRVARDMHGDIANLLDKTRREHEDVTEEIRKQNHELEQGKKEIEAFKKKMDKVQGGFNKAQGIASSLGSEMGGMVSGAADFAMGLGKAVLTGNYLEFALDLALDAMAALIGASMKLSSILAEGIRSSGLQDFEQLLYANVAATNQFGLDAEATSRLLSGLNDGFGQFALVSDDMKGKLIEQAAALSNLGVSAAESGKLFDTLVVGMGMSASEVDQVGDQFTQLGQIVGKSTATMVSDFNRMSGSLAQFGSGALDVFQDVQEAAARTGISADTMMGVFEKTTTFSGAADMAGKLNGVLGTTVDAMELINSENPAETMDILRNSLLDAGKSFEEMTMQERRFLAETSGINMAELQKGLSGGELDTKSPGETALESLSKKAMEVGKQISATFDKVFNALATSGVLKDLEETLGSLFGEGSSTDSFANSVIPGMVGGAKILVGLFKSLANAFKIAMAIISPILSVFTFATQLVGELVMAIGKLSEYITSFLIEPMEKLAATITGGISGFLGSVFGADDYVSKGGSTSSSYGDRMLFDKGDLVALNDGDTIIAGTNVQFANDMVSQAANQRTGIAANNAAGSQQRAPAPAAQVASGPSTVNLMLDRINLGKVVGDLVEEKMSVAT